jgi:hypothetical protein
MSYTQYLLTPTICRDLVGPSRDDLWESLIIECHLPEAIFGRAPEFPDSYNQYDGDGRH